MARFADLSVSAFLDALASSEPTPGGGTAAAIAGAMGASLLMMVAGLSKSRTGTDEERVALAEAAAASSPTATATSLVADRLPCRATVVPSRMASPATRRVSSGALVAALKAC